PVAEGTVHENHECDDIPDKTEVEAIPAPAFAGAGCGRDPIFIGNASPAKLGPGLRRGDEHPMRRAYSGSGGRLPVFRPFFRKISSISFAAALSALPELASPISAPRAAPCPLGNGAVSSLPTTADLLGSSKLANAAVTTSPCAALPVARSWITSPWPSEPWLAGPQRLSRSMYWSSAAFACGLLIVTV